MNIRQQLNQVGIQIPNFGIKCAIIIFGSYINKKVVLNVGDALFSFNIDHFLDTEIDGSLCNNGIDDCIIWLNDGSWIEWAYNDREDYHFEKFKVPEIPTECLE